VLNLDLNLKFFYLPTKLLEVSSQSLDQLAKHPRRPVPAAFQDGRKFRGDVPNTQWNGDAVFGQQSTKSGWPVPSSS